MDKIAGDCVEATGSCGESTENTGLASNGEGLPSLGVVLGFRGDFPDKSKSVSAF